MSNLIQEKAYRFSLRIVRLSEYLAKERHEYVLSKKVLDSGVNISLFVEEAQQAPDKPDFIQRYSLSNKEAFKTNLLLRLLRDSEFVTAAQAESLLIDCEELQKLLISSLKTARKDE
jgi:four helix bundle protein